MRLRPELVTPSHPTAPISTPTHAMPANSISHHDTQSQCIVETRSCHVDLCVHMFEFRHILALA